MSISQEELQKIGQKLSKIPADNPKILENISDILKYMDTLAELDTSGVIPTVSVVTGQAHLREDILKPSLTTPSEILACSEQKIIAQQIVLPNIMK